MFAKVVIAIALGTLLNPLPGAAQGHTEAPEELETLYRTVLAFLQDKDPGEVLRANKELRLAQSETGPLPDAAASLALTKAAGHLRIPVVERDTVVNCPGPAATIDECSLPEANSALLTLDTITLRADGSAQVRVYRTFSGESKKGLNAEIWELELVRSSGRWQIERAVLAGMT